MSTTITLTKSRTVKWYLYSLINEYFSLWVRIFDYAYIYIRSDMSTCTIKSTIIKFCISLLCKIASSLATGAINKVWWSTYRDLDTELPGLQWINIKRRKRSIVILMHAVPNRTITYSSGIIYMFNTWHSFLINIYIHLFNLRLKINTHNILWTVTVLPFSLLKTDHKSCIIICKQNCPSFILCYTGIQAYEEGGSKWTMTLHPHTNTDLKSLISYHSCIIMSFKI